MRTQPLYLLLLVAIMTGFASCSSKKDTAGKGTSQEQRQYTLERVGNAQVVQLYANGFDQLTPKEKIFSYYLYLAALAGRDIAIDQHHSNALEVRDLCEQVYKHAFGVDTTALQHITKYLKLFWINNGFYDSYTSAKFVPECTFEEFKTACEIAEKNNANFALNGESLNQKLDRLRKIMFDPAFQSAMTNKTPGEDWIKQSAVNFYGNDLTYKEVESWATAGSEKYPLNSQVVKEKGTIREKVWRAGGDGIEPGMYADDLKAVIKYLEVAIPYAASEYQAETVRLLTRYFKTGEEEDFRKYNIHWVKDSSAVDFIMGFIEVYLDPRGQKAEWESSIFYTDPAQTKMMQNLAKYAQYFEHNAPWKEEFKATIERSPIANVINVMVETGGTGPVSPIGINLPNEQAIRQQYGSKSVLLHNVVEAGEKSSGKDMLHEFAYDQEEITNQEKYGSIADNLHTAMHEVIGHGSGKASATLNGKDPADFLPGYYNTLEEARADLVALWNAWDDKLVDIGIASDKEEVRKIGETMYQQAIRVALTQLRRIGTKDQLEEDHMKNRQLIAHYIMKNSNAVSTTVRDGKTYYHVVDFNKAHETIGVLLAELMRIKAEGDLASAKNLIDMYALKVDPTLRDEVQSRVKKLNIASYNGFVQPRLGPIMNSEAKIVDAKVSYPLDLAKQMLEYSTFTKNEKARTLTANK